MNKPFLTFGSERGFFKHAVLEVFAFLRVLRAWFLPPSCRFFPSCSEYAVEAVQRYGVFRSLPVVLGRLFRCHPWHPGGIDFLP
ncbi:MAG: membrane protein insertion efficiency factor YidD [Elusimicrobia bacterium]|nr:membrane protein insertion efficiency factor YidD [Elusimicrobiota bacterium]